MAKFSLARRALLVFVVPVLPSLTACGSYKDKSYKDFPVYIDTNDTQLKNKTIDMIRDYNAAVGFQALQIAGEKGEGSSLIHFTAGLRDQTGKIGFGQALVQAENEPQYRRVEMRPLNRDLRYSLDVEFDTAYFSSRINADHTTKEGRELYILFAHEIGHGFFLGHDPSERAVMYKVVLGREDTDFATYYQEVRNFFSEP